MRLLDFLKTAADFAPGLPDPKRFGTVEEIPSGKLLQYVIQRHLAERAGPHYDVRMGGGPPGRELFSWATRKELPGPGGKISLFQQPLHRGSYAGFEGEIVSGYGKGTVKTHDKGSIVVTHADKDKIKFLVAHKKYPEYFTMVRQSGPPTPKTPNMARKQGGTWLLINTTPTSGAKLLKGKPEEVGLEKMRYAKVDAKDVDKLFSPDYMVQAKMDGASALYHLLADRIETLSYRTSVTGRPIIHTYRVFGPAGATKGVKIPKELVGTILKGEIYGQRTGKRRANAGQTPGEVIPPQELGGLLNASVQKSIETQQAKGINLKNMLFDIVRLGKQPIPPASLPAAERMAKLTEIMKVLPKDKFHLPETAQTPEEAKALWERISTGKHPLTSEGVVAWPTAGGPPKKVKVLPESDVWVRSIFPGEKRLAGTGAGGFEYSTAPEGPVVGRVGTGFSEDVRKEMLQDPEGWLGRMARIRAQGKYPSGAYRAPAFLGLHEDYPVAPAGLPKP
jgi:hypothetical protein